MKLKIIDYGYKKAPVRAHYNDSGMDVFSPEAVDLYGGEMVTIRLGFGLEIPDGYEIQVRPKSSFNAKGILTQFGTVDAGYKGDISVVLVNFTDIPFAISEGDKIAQLVLCPVAYADAVKELGEERNEGGFGSTGK